MYLQGIQSLIRIVFISKNETSSLVSLFMKIFKDPYGKHYTLCYNQLRLVKKLKCRWCGKSKWAMIQSKKTRNANFHCSPVCVGKSAKQDQLRRRLGLARIGRYWQTDEDIVKIRDGKQLNEE